MSAFHIKSGKVPENNYQIIAGIRGRVDVTDSEALLRIKMEDRELLNELQRMLAGLVASGEYPIELILYPNLNNPFEFIRWNDAIIVTAESASVADESKKIVVS